MKYSDDQRLKKIYEKAVALHEYVLNNDIKREDVLNDIHVQWCVTTPLYNIGEHSYHLSSEYRDAHGEIPWMLISGLRHRLIHGYDDTDWNVVADIVFEDLPVLIEELKNAI